MVYVAGGDGVGDFVVEDCFEGGEDADAAYIEELVTDTNVRMVGHGVDIFFQAGDCFSKRDREESEGIR